ncbi:MAG TPA: polysaccharide biosynthesis protein [Candidatus Blautia intestinigallinarum]|nr:polysaccharide biosynthesis protein [Candidatus Blautia intestinigallinarum]
MGKKDNTLVRNASFLMIAALVSKIIGLIYKRPLSSMLGNESFACFQFAQNIYFILLMIASFSIPQAVSKLMAERIAFHRYRDAQKVFKGALIYAVIAGGVVALFCLFGSSILIPKNMSNARLALQMLSPTIFLSGILGVFRGYFQAYRNTMPTSLSQILEQIANACIALLMVHFMQVNFSAASGDVQQRWEAAGATIGTGAGVLSALLLMLGIYGLNRRFIRRRIAKDRRSHDESYSQVLRLIVLIASPIILSSFIYNVNGYINSYMYSSIMGYRGVEESVVQSLYSQNSYFMTIINIPLTLASTAPTSMIPEVSAQYARGDIRGANLKTDQATWISMLISIPAAVGLAVLAGPVTRILFPLSTTDAANILAIGAVTVILNGCSNISNGVLQGIGKPRIPMINAAIALVVDVIVMAVLLFATDLGVYSIVCAMIVYAVVMCVLNDRAMKKYMKYRNPWRKAYLPPLLASVPMGIVAGGVYYGLYLLVPINLICLILSIGLGALTYFCVYMKIAKPSEEELGGLPGGGMMIRLSRKLRLI